MCKILFKKGTALNKDEHNTKTWMTCSFTLTGYSEFSKPPALLFHNNIKSRHSGLFVVAVVSMKVRRIWRKYHSGRGTRRQKQYY